MKQTEMIKLPRPAIDELLRMAVDLKLLRKENKMLRAAQMGDIQFKVLCDLLMVSDPWPLDTEAEQTLKSWANSEAPSHGFADWVDAYHGIGEVIKVGY